VVHVVLVQCNLKAHIDRVVFVKIRENALVSIPIPRLIVNFLDDRQDDIPLVVHGSNVSYFELVPLHDIVV